MKRSTVLIRIIVIILGIGILDGLSLTDSEPIEKTKKSLLTIEQEP